MGTTISLLCPEGGADSPAADAAFGWFREVDRRFSPFIDDSEVSRLARGELARPEVSADLAEILALADAAEWLSDGAFDIRGHRGDGAPDPTGLVKGWSVDRAVAILADGGIYRFCLSAGGDVLARGGRSLGRPWRVGIAGPVAGTPMVLAVQANDLAVATSGTTERGLHITDPRRGRSADGLLTVSVVGPSLGRADAYATAAFAMGAHGLRWIDAMPGYDAVGMTHEHQLTQTRGLSRFLA